MLSIRKPTTEVIKRFLDSQKTLDFTYPDVGATESCPPKGYVVDRTRKCLGRGRAVFEEARSALYGWRQLRLGWLEVWPPSSRIEAGQTVAIVARSLGVWFVNACRVVYVLDQPEEHRFGFAYGTLPGHVATGEERFLVEWDSKTDEVWFDILAFSRPRHFLARWGYLYVRRVQKYFGRSSARAMEQAVGVERSTPVECHRTVPEGETSLEAKSLM
ncbi:MAG: DUF1990 family protein [Gemmataceae bacterium]